jgi:hypothetical protein
MPQIKQSAGFQDLKRAEHCPSDACSTAAERPIRLMATGVPCRGTTVSPYTNDKGEAVPTVAAIDERE